MESGPDCSYWIATRLERPAPVLECHRPGEFLHRAAWAGFAVSWGWMLVAAIITLARLATLVPSPWGSLQIAALIVGPGTAGIALSLLLEVVARRQRLRH